jgi:hypothetical protein
MQILEQQRHYHLHVAHRQHALRHRVHSLNSVLFGLTAVGALTHLFVHTLWLSLVTTFFPALGASLHGALAQSEAYRLEVTSERLTGELQGSIGHIRAALLRSRTRSRRPSHRYSRSTRTGICWCGRTICRSRERAQ